MQVTKGLEVDHVRVSSLVEVSEFRWGASEINLFGRVCLVHPVEKYCLLDIGLSTGSSIRTG